MGLRFDREGADGLAAYWTGEPGGGASAGGWLDRRLERIAGLIDWAQIEHLLAPLRAPRLSLAQWYQLSDPGLEEALADRLSFRRFCGFGLVVVLPDLDPPRGREGAR